MRGQQVSLPAGEHVRRNLCIKEAMKQTVFLWLLLHQGHHTLRAAPRQTLALCDIWPRAHHWPCHTPMRRRVSQILMANVDIPVCWLAY